jgi:hypothetical protein
MDLSASLADLITGYSDQKKQLEDSIDSMKRAKLANDAQALAMYDQQQQVKAAAKEFKEVQGQIKGVASGFGALKGVVQNVVGAFVKSTAAVVGFTAAASPQAAAGLGDIFRILAAHIGIALIPVIFYLVDGIEQAIDWFESLDDQTKTWIAVIAAGLPILLAIGPAVGGLVTAFTALASPVGLLTLGILAAVVAVGYFIMKFNGIAKELDDYRASLKKGLNEGWNRKELEESDAYKKIAAEKDPKKREQLATGIVNQAQSEVNRALKAQNELGGGAWYKFGFDSDEVKEARRRSEAAQKNLKIAMGAHKELVGGEVQTPQGEEEQEDKGTAGLQKQMGKLMQGLTAKMSMEQKPQFSSIEEARRKVQINALKDPLERELIMLQREYYKKWLDGYQAWKKKNETPNSGVFGK